MSQSTFAAARAAARAAASGETPHGLTPHELVRMEQRFASMQPTLATATAARIDALEDVLPDGASWTTRTASGGTQSGNSFVTNQRPYQPEFESPDRQQYPVHRILANRYWRMFYKLDPVIGTGIDMFSELPWSGFDMTGEGVEGEIRDALEDMVEETEVRSILPHLVREFLVVGEACPHLFYDDTKGIWTHIAMHNPDQLDVIHAPFIKMDPVVEFVPDDRLRKVLSSDHEMLRAVRSSMPPELVSKLQARQNIPLSPVNFTFLPRKLHPYDVRGTSLLSRMWRILMLEDGIFNATLATARRHAGPLKIAKLGDPATGWIPEPEQEKRLLQLLSQAEMDVHAWLVYHYGISFELVGTTERVMTIDRQWDLIERVKLVALGINKAFLHGEVTYASAASGLTVFLQRLRTIREYFEAKWLIPKFFRPIAEMNGWVKPTEAELAGRIRVRRSRAELREDRRYIIPRLEWDRGLDPSVDSDMINAAQSLSGLGVTFSKTTLMSLANRSYEEELEQMGQDAEMEQRKMAQNPALAQALQMAQAMAGGGPGGGMPPGGGGGGMLPGIDPSEMGLAPPPLEGGGDFGPPQEGGPGEPLASGEKSRGDDERPAYPDTSGLRAALWNADGRYGAWTKNEVQDLVEMFRQMDTTEVTSLTDSSWIRAATHPRVKEAIDGNDPQAAWTELEDWLIAEGYPTEHIIQLEDVLTAEKVLPDRVAEIREQVASLEKQLGADTGDSSFFVGSGGWNLPLRSRKVR